MNYKRLSLALGLFLVLLVWLFLGIEEIGREHTTDTEFFLKQRPDFRIVFRNPAVCGECDAEPFSTLDSATRAELRDFCQVRFGLEDVRICYAIYEEWQRMVNERVDHCQIPSVLQCRDLDAMRRSFMTGSP
jgi:hypothetical protein